MPPFLELSHVNRALLTANYWRDEISRAVEMRTILLGVERDVDERLYESCFLSPRDTTEISLWLSILNRSFSIDLLEDDPKYNIVKHAEQRICNIYAKVLFYQKKFHYRLVIIGVISVISAGCLFFIGSFFIATTLLIWGIGLLYLSYEVEKRQEKFCRNGLLYNKQIILLMEITSAVHLLKAEALVPSRLEDLTACLEGIIIKMIISQAYDGNALRKSWPRPGEKTLIEWAAFFSLDKVYKYLNLIMTKYDTEEKNREIFQRVAERTLRNENYLDFIIQA